MFSSAGLLEQRQVMDIHWINSLAPGGFDYSLNLVNFKLISTINVF